MHSKKRLVKQVLHTVMAMSIVYSSGLSVLVSKAGAMELLGVITDSNTEFSVKGIDGEKYISDSGVAPTSGSAIGLKGVISEAKINNGIILIAVGGTGGDGVKVWRCRYKQHWRWGRR